MSVPSIIRALVIQDDGTKKVQSIPFDGSRLAAHEILVRVRAVGLNPTDWKLPLRIKATGKVCGCDGAGDVVAVGSEVTYFKVGDRAAAFASGASSEDNGSFSEYVRYDQTVCMKLPQEMTYEEAASFPASVAHLTAIQSLYIHLAIPTPFAKSKPEKSILIWGGSTAAGHHAIQLAVHSGLKVFTTASPAAHSELLALGASQCFDYKDPEVAKKIQAAAGEPGVVYAVDCIAKQGTTDRVIDAMSAKEGGSVVILLPVSDETKTRRSDVTVIHTLLYLVLGPFMSLPFRTDDRKPMMTFLQQDLPRLLEGWKAGEGSKNFKPQRLRHMEGGLDNISEGLQIMQSGNYSREKLVYTIACA